MGRQLGSGRRAVRVSLLAAGPWRRAPILLLRTPGTALAITGAAVIVAFLGSSWPLFLGSVADASHERQVGERCPWELGATVVPTAEVASPVLGDDGAAPTAAGLGTVVSEVGAATPGLGEPVRTSTASVELVLPGRQVGVVLLARTGSSGNVSVRAGATDRGAALLSDRTSEELGLVPGAVLNLRAGSQTSEVLLAGTYEHLADPLPSYWCSLRRSFLPDGYAGDPPPPVVLVDQSLFDEVVGELAVPSGATWELPLVGSPSRAVAASIAARIEALEERLERSFEGATSSPATDGPPVRLSAAGSVRAVTSTLPFIVRRSATVSEGLEAGLAPTAAGAAAAGALLLIGTGWYWVERRTGELAVLRRLGIGPLAIGGKAVLELLLPVAVGTAGGVVAASAVIAVVGPGGVPDVSVVAEAMRWAAVATLAGLVGAAVLVVVRSAAADRSGGARATGPAVRWLGALRAVPWEVALGAGAVRLAADPGRRGVDIGPGTLDLDGLSFALPILVVAAGGALAGRLLRLGMAVVGERGKRLPTAAWLGLRRLTARPGAPALFTACVVTSVGVLVYASTVSASLERSLPDKAALAVGADALVGTIGTQAPPAGLNASISPVASIEGGQRSDPAVTLLGVDPATAGRVTTHPGISDDRLRSLLGALARPGRVAPAIVVGRSIPRDRVVRLTDGSGVDVPFEIVGRLDGFPGMSQSESTVVIDIERVRALGVPYTEGLWVDGPLEPVLEELGAAGVEVSSVRVPGEALDTATFVAVVWTFGFVGVLALLGALVSAVGLLVYLDARQRSRQLAYGLSRHMGLSRATHRRSLGLELCAIVLPSAVGGTIVGFASGAAFAPRLDPLPRFEPTTTFVAPWAVIVVATALAGLLCVVGAAVGQRAADSVGLAAALRHGG